MSGHAARHRGILKPRLHTTPSPSGPATLCRLPLAVSTPPSTLLHAYAFSRERELGSLSRYAAGCWVLGARCLVLCSCSGWLQGCLPKIRNPSSTYASNRLPSLLPTPVRKHPSSANCTPQSRCIYIHTPVLYIPCI